MDPFPGPTCPVPAPADATIRLGHGSGGMLTHRLLEQHFFRAFENPYLREATDGAILDAIAGGRLAFTTDAYVVRPLFFPGGDIGRLSVFGTVNDLAMCGARPLFLAAAFILEEGFATADLARIVASMQAAAQEAGVVIVTGDTKVVDRGRGDGVYVTTTGLGAIAAREPIAPFRIAPGDAVIVSGDIGRHGIAILGAREGFAFETPVSSDTALLHTPVLDLLQEGVCIHALRDITRGGLATALVELAEASGTEIRLRERDTSLSDEVRGACEILGLDPLHVACEGRFVACLPEGEADRALAVLHRHEVSRQARVTGHVTAAPRPRVLLETPLGTTRVIDRLPGDQLPRIC